MEEAGSGHEDQSQHTNVGCLGFLSRSQVTLESVIQSPSTYTYGGSDIVLGPCLLAVSRIPARWGRGVVPAWQVSGRFV
jgi:hypothetical protein